MTSHDSKSGLLPAAIGLWLLAPALSVFSWGGYGHAAHASNFSFPSHNGLLSIPWIGVGYLLAGVAVPAITIFLLHRSRSETEGGMTKAGIVEGFFAGLLGAVGANSVVFALSTGIGAHIVMPIVFGGAPVVNTLYVMLRQPPSSWDPKKKKLFFLGIGLLIGGAAIVLSYKHLAGGAKEGEGQIAVALFWCACAFLAWGIYGPIMHGAQAKMHGSPLGKAMRTLLWVGVAYLVYGALMVALLPILSEDSIATVFSTADGALWGVVAGILGCLGAVGIILGVRYAPGGPLLVMPIVFGGAPVMNTLYWIAIEKSGSGNWPNPATLPVLLLGVAVGVFGLIVVLRNKPAPPKPAKKVAG